MKNLIYVHEPVFIPDTDLQIVALSEKAHEPYALRKKDVTMYPPQDLEVCFPLISYLVRMAETGSNVPDYDEVKKATEKAKKALLSQGRL